MQDKALLAMNAQGIDWKDIGIIMGGKDKDAVKARYKELMAAKDKEDAGTGKGESSEKKEKKGKEGKKHKEGKEGKDKRSNGKEKEKELKGILKNGGSDGGTPEYRRSEGESSGGHSAINVFFESDDELSKDDVSACIACTCFFASSFEV